jgi:arylsulfatase A-like enzyme
MPEKVKTMQKKPNILFIMADDIGWFNVSAYNHGLMGYRTPNIDRIAKEGAMFTDFYGQQSCTAGRAEFITGGDPGAQRRGPVGRAVHEEFWLCHRSVWEEPSR